MEATAVGKKLFLGLFACALITLNHFPDGSGSNSEWLR